MELFCIFKETLFIYLAAPGLSCSMQDLVSWAGIEPGTLALRTQNPSQLDHQGSPNSSVSWCWWCLNNCMHLSKLIKMYNKKENFTPCGVGEDSFFRVPWTARRSNQSILKEISLGSSLEGLMLKLKLQYFCHLMWRADSFEKTLMLGKIEGRRRRDNRGWEGWMASLTQWRWVWVDSGSWWWTGRPGVLWSMSSQRVGHNWATELNWTDFYQTSR